MAADDAAGGVPGRTSDAEVTEVAPDPATLVPFGRDLVGYDRSVRAVLGAMLLGRFRILDTADFLGPEDLGYVGAHHSRVLRLLRAAESGADRGWSGGLPTGMTSGRIGRYGLVEFARRARRIPIAHGRDLGLAGAAGEYVRYVQAARLSGLKATQWPQVDLAHSRRFGGEVMSILDGRLRQLTAAAAAEIRIGLVTGKPVDRVVDVALRPVRDIMAQRWLAASRSGFVPLEGWGARPQLPGPNTAMWTPFNHAAALAAQLRELAERSDLASPDRAASLAGLLREYVGDLHATHPATGEGMAPHRPAVRPDVTALADVLDAEPTEPTERIERTESTRTVETPPRAIRLEPHTDETRRRRGR